MTPPTLRPPPAGGPGVWEVGSRWPCVALGLGARRGRRGRRLPRIADLLGYALTASGRASTVCGAASAPGRPADRRGPRWHRRWPGPRLPRRRAASSSSPGCSSWSPATGTPERSSPVWSSRPCSWRRLRLTRPADLGPGVVAQSARHLHGRLGAGPADPRPSYRPCWPWSPRPSSAPRPSGSWPRPSATGSR